MPMSVQELFAATGTSRTGVVRWGQQVPLQLPGVYCVAATEDPRVEWVDMPTYTPSPLAYNRLMEARPYLSVNNRTATHASLADRLGSFWIPNEPVLYIGLAGTSLQNRINQFYNTKLGARSPHSGGWWLKTLADLDKLFVHYATCDAVDEHEQAMLQRFAGAVPAEQRIALFDRERVAPFANVAVRKSINKRHGLSNYKSDPPHSVLPKSHTAPSDAPTRAVHPRQPGADTNPGSETYPGDFSHVVYSQPVTDGDKTRSSLRIPSASKFAFPASGCEVGVSIDDEFMNVLWRPNGSRSGTLGLGVEVMRSLQERGERIGIGVKGGTYFIIRKK